MLSSKNFTATAADELITEHKGNAGLCQAALLVLYKFNSFRKFTIKSFVSCFSSAYTDRVNEIKK